MNGSCFVKVAFRIQVGNVQFIPDVPEEKRLKNRMHLDLRIGTHDMEAVVEKLQGRGATFLHRGQQGPDSLITMADPEGNEFCVA